MRIIEYTWEHVNISRRSHERETVERLSQVFCIGRAFTRFDSKPPCPAVLHESYPHRIIKGQYQPTTCRSRWPTSATHDMRYPPIAMQAKSLVESKEGPFVTIAVQECAQMNVLLREIRRSLVELLKSIEGQLHRTQAMEDLHRTLSQNEVTLGTKWATPVEPGPPSPLASPETTMQTSDDPVTGTCTHHQFLLHLSSQVPGRGTCSSCSWREYAWPSRKNLSCWVPDVVERVGHLRRWTANMKVPNPLWLPGLFNPGAFLTAVRRVTARRLNSSLEEIEVETWVTSMETREEVAALESSSPSPLPPPYGALVHGLFLHGARWRTSSSNQVCVLVCDRDTIIELDTRTMLPNRRLGTSDSPGP